MQTPLVSIIIPTYNRAHLIGETLDSILAQTYKNWECIVIDDGSTDHTNIILTDYCKKDSRFQYYQRPIDRPKGANACRNYGFELSKGEYVNWFDSDDLMHIDKLLLQIKALELSNFEFSVCQSVIFEKTIDNIEGYRTKKIISENIFYDYLSERIAWLTQAPMWKRSFLNEFEYLFDEELQAAQEWEFHCRILSMISKYHTVETPLVYLRKHDESITFNNNKLLREKSYYLARKKIYKNSSVLKNDKVNSFLQNYLLSNFKYFISIKEWYLAWDALTDFVLLEKELDISTKLNALLGLISYTVFNRGYYLINKVKYNK